MTALVIAAVLLMSNLPIAVAAGAASDITKKCSFIPSSNPLAYKLAYDGKYSTLWTAAESTPFIDFTVPAKYSFGGMYFVWNKPPERWELFRINSDNSQESALKGGTDGYLTDYQYIPQGFQGSKRFRLVMTPDTSGTVEIAELSIWTVGRAPYYAPQWQPEPARFDGLVFSCHPDDECLYLSPPVPTYIDQGKTFKTVYMTYGSSPDSVRRFEGQESVWSLGERSEPVMRYAVDVKTVTKEEAMFYWPLDETVAFMVQQIRRFKPGIIITHDVNGEYWHGAHRLTSYAAQLAFAAAGDPNQYPDSAGKYGTWNAGKLYIHLYNKNVIKFSLTKKLKDYGNQTVLQVIKKAYSRHRSQLPGRRLPTSGAYDMRKFGLFYTNVGNDSTHKDMFENVSMEALLALNPWYNSIVTDRTALAALLSEAKSKVETDYTAQSWTAANLNAIITQAQAVMDNISSTQAQLDGQVKALRDAIAKLIVKPALQRIEITHPADKLAYFTADALDISGLAVTGTYSDGTTSQLPITLANITGFDSSVPCAAQTLTISVEGKTATYTVSIKAPAMDGIAITHPADKLIYTVGEPLDITGLAVTGHYENGATAILTVTATDVSGFDSSVPNASQILTVTKGGMTAAYTIEIQAVILQSIEITTPPDKLVYTVGEVLDITGMAITGHYSDGNTIPMEASVTDISGFDSSVPVAGQELTVTIDGQKAIFIIDIVSGTG